MGGLLRRFSSGILIIFWLAASACTDSPTEPTTADMTGTWTGTGAYPNAPFQLVLTQTGSAVKGEYSDRLDRSTAVSGTFTPPTISISVNFGDAGLTLNGSVITARRVEGTMFTPSLNNQMFPFTMTR